VNLFIPGVAIPQGSKRALLRKGSTTPIVVDANRHGLANWRAQVSAYAMRERQTTGTHTYAGSVAVRLDFYLRRPENHYLPANGKRPSPELRSDAPMYCIKAPDIDKLTRAILDALTDAGVWKDDAQVVKVVATKMYADPRLTGVEVHVAPWGG
jgi:Holliday junction resolvase RusA-like endonuclease